MFFFFVCVFLNSSNCGLPTLLVFGTPAFLLNDDWHFGDCFFLGTIRINLYFTGSPSRVYFCPHIFWTSRVLIGKHPQKEECRYMDFMISFNYSSLNIAVPQSYKLLGMYSNVYTLKKPHWNLRVTLCSEPSFWGDERGL